MTTFKDEYSFEKRSEVALRMRQKYPDRVPVIVEKAEDAKTVPICEKKKFLVPFSLTVGEFQTQIRHHMPSLAPSQAIFLFVQGKDGPKLPSSSSTMVELYETHQDPDQFVYIVYSGENSFGAFESF